MTTYKVMAVFWEDHVHVNRGPLLRNPDDAIYAPVLSIGALLGETDKCYMLASDIERLEDGNDCTYMIILKSTVVGVKEYGTIDLENLEFS